MSTQSKIQNPKSKIQQKACASVIEKDAGLVGEPVPPVLQRCSAASEAPPERHQFAVEHDLFFKDEEAGLI